MHTNKNNSNKVIQAREVMSSCTRRVGFRLGGVRYTVLSTTILLIGSMLGAEEREE